MMPTVMTMTTLSHKDGFPRTNVMNACGLFARLEFQMQLRPKLMMMINWKLILVPQDNHHNVIIPMIISIPIRIPMIIPQEPLPASPSAGWSPPRSSSLSRSSHCRTRSDWSRWNEICIFWAKWYYTQLYTITHDMTKIWRKRLYKDTIRLQ